MNKSAFYIFFAIVVLVIFPLNAVAFDDDRTSPNSPETQQNDAPLPIDSERADDKRPVTQLNMSLRTKFANRKPPECIRYRTAYGKSFILDRTGDNSAYLKFENKREIYPLRAVHGPGGTIVFRSYGGQKILKVRQNGDLTVFHHSHARGVPGWRVGTAQKLAIDRSKIDVEGLTRSIEEELVRHMTDLEAHTDQDIAMAKERNDRSEEVAKHLGMLMKKHRSKRLDNLFAPEWFIVDQDGDRPTKMDIPRPNEGNEGLISVSQDRSVNPSNSQEID